MGKWDLVAQRRELALRAKDREEDEAREIMRNNLEAERKQNELNEGFNNKEYTFKPNLKWNLIKERRIISQDTPTREETSRKTFLTRSEREKLERDLRYEEMDLKECTFKPKTNWSSNTEAGDGEKDSSCSNVIN